MGLTRGTMRRTVVASGSLWEGVGHPVRLGFGLAQVLQAFVLADGDGVADIHLAADGEDGVGIEAAVGP